MSNTIVALNTGDTATTSLDTRFSQVLERVHDYERSSAPNAARGASIGERVAAWLGLPMARVQWAGAFALGLAVGVGILLATLQSDGVDTLSPPAYQTHSSVEAPLRLRLEFDRAPSAAELTNLKRSVTASANWQEVSETGFLIELPDELTVGAVTDIRSRLLANDSVVSVDIAIDNVSSE